MYVVRDRQRKQIRQQEKSFAWEGLFFCGSRLLQRGKYDSMGIGKFWDLVK